MTTDAVTAYADAVRAELDDLPDAVRVELLDDLDTHLAEVAADEPDVPLVTKLGEPSAYAAELRSAAGLAPRTARRRRRLPFAAVVGRLRPAWWVLRGYLLVAWHSGTPVWVVLLAVTASVLWSSRPVRIRLPRLRRVGDALVAVAGLALLLLLPGRLPAPPAPIETSWVTSLPMRRIVMIDRGESLIGPYGPITNLFPYDVHGQPLHDVLLYDQDGHPVEVGVGRSDLVRNYPTGPGGRPLVNAYPQYVAERDDNGDLVPMPAPTPARR